MADCMMFPSEWEKFIEDYSFKDKEEVYTNGSVLIPVFRVEQMVEHYFGGKWIPVSERLPEDGRQVLACTKKGKAFSAHYDHFWGDWSVSHTVKITHWMPLPEPPQED